MNPTPIALVLGGTGGIGKATVLQLLRRGARPIAVARDATRLEALRAELGVEIEVCDVLEKGAIDAVIQQVVERHGRLDALAHCVGSILLKPAHLTTDDDWDQTIALNLTSAFRVLRAAAGTMMKTGGGSIVFCSSVAAQRGLMNHEAIGAAKAGVEGLVRSAAASYARHQLRVNAVAPGLVKTPLSQRFWSVDASRKVSEAMHPLGRLGEPEDIASAIAWLLDPAQGWVTGQILAIDGGLGAVQSR